MLSKTDSISRVTFDNCGTYVNFHCLDNGLVVLIDHSKRNMLLYNPINKTIIAEKKIGPGWNNFLFSLDDNFLLNTGENSPEIPQQALLICSNSLETKEINQSLSSYAQGTAMKRQQFYTLKKSYL